MCVEYLNDTFWVDGVNPMPYLPRQWIKVYLYVFGGDFWRRGVIVGIGLGVEGETAYVREGPSEISYVEDCCKGFNNYYKSSKELAIVRVKEPTC